MRKNLLNCNSTAGTVEMLLSVREVGTPNAMICADYKKLDKDKFSVIFYYGLTDADIMHQFNEFIWNVPYNQLADSIVEWVEAQLHTDFKKELKKELSEMRAEMDVPSDCSWRMVILYPEKEYTGYDNIELIVMFNDSEMDIYIENRNGNLMFIEIASGYISMALVNSHIKNMVRSGRLKDFINDNKDEIFKEREVE